MNARLLKATVTAETCNVYPLLCMDCEHDVFEWMDSMPILNPMHEQIGSLGQFRCINCGFTTLLNETEFLLEATDERDAWFAHRRAK